MNNTIENLKKYNLWRRGDESIEQPDPKDIGIWIDEICEIAEKLERERDEARHKLELCMAANSDVARIAKERDEAREALDCLLAVIGLTPIAGNKKALQEAVDQCLVVLRKQEGAK